MTRLIAEGGSSPVVEANAIALFEDALVGKELRSDSRRRRIKAAEAVHATVVDEQGGRRSS